MTGVKAIYHVIYDTWTYYNPNDLEKVTLEVTYYLEIPPFNNLKD